MEWSQKMEEAVKNGQGTGPADGQRSDPAAARAAGEAQDPANVVPDPIQTSNADDTEMPSSGPKPAPDTVGNLLLRTRQRFGLSVEDVAAILRINWRYVEAIETGRYEALPGRAYAVGFVRAYAEYLNLDTSEMVERFKKEVATLSDQQQLVFPEPVSEGRVPTGAAIFLSLLLLAGGYGIWLYTSSDEPSPVAGVADVPDRLRVPESLQEVIARDGSMPAEPAQATQGEAQSPTQPSAAAAESATTQSNASVPGPVPTPAPPTTPALAPAPPASPVAEVSVGPIGEPGAASAAGDPSSNASAAGSAAGSTPSPEEVVARLTGLPVSEIASPVAREPEATLDASATSAEVGAEATEIAATEPDEPPQPVIYGEENVNARIVLRAVAETWLQIRAEDGETLLSRILNPGDSFLVPNRTGVVMRIGNAGGVNVFVDGTLAPSLGPSGSVRSNIRLEPEPLLAGTAVPAVRRPAPQPEDEAGTGVPTPAPAATNAEPTDTAAPPAAVPSPAPGAERGTFPQPIEN